MKFIDGKWQHLYNVMGLPLSTVVILIDPLFSKKETTLVLRKYP